jgi:acetate kinase
MGFTPLESFGYGNTMHRPYPAIVVFSCVEGVSETVEGRLNKESGLLGISAQFAALIKVFLFIAYRT